LTSLHPTIKGKDLHALSKQNSILTWDFFNVTNETRFQEQNKITVYAFSH
jgi:hypothetical protein